MEFSKINTLMFETLDSISPIETSRVSMFDLEDKYRYLPFCRFKFKDKKKEDKIYEIIKNSVENFEGYLKWRLLTKSGSENFLIIPFISDGEKHGICDKDYLISLYGELGYRKIIDESIDDILNLAKTIYNNCS